MPSFFWRRFHANRSVTTREEVNIHRENVRPPVADEAHRPLPAVLFAKSRYAGARTDAAAVFDQFADAWRTVDMRNDLEQEVRRRKRRSDVRQNADGGRIAAGGSFDHSTDSIEPIARPGWVSAPHECAAVCRRVTAGFREAPDQVKVARNQVCHLDLWRMPLTFNHVGRGTGVSESLTRSSLSRLSSRV